MWRVASDRLIAPAFGGSAGSLLDAPWSMPGERTKFASNVAQSIPQRALQRATELLGYTFHSDQHFIVRVGSGYQLVAWRTVCLRAICGISWSRLRPIFGFAFGSQARLRVAGSWSGLHEVNYDFFL